MLKTKTGLDSVDLNIFIVNLALRKPAFEDNIYIHANVTAGNAVDGHKSNLRGTGGECSMSTEKKRTATWWVNLTSTRSIHDIRIYYMTDNVPWGMYLRYFSLIILILVIKINVIRKE